MMSGIEMNRPRNGPSAQLKGFLATDPSGQLEKSRDALNDRYPKLSDKFECAQQSHLQPPYSCVNPVPLINTNQKTDESSLFFQKSQ